MDISNKHAPLKRSSLKFKANHASNMTKRLRKAIIKRSELKSRYLKIQIEESFKSYTK